MHDQTRARVERRRVFYIPGYDPVHPRRYRELYRREGAQQAAISGYDLRLRGARKAPGCRYGWHVEARIEDQPVAADFEVLVWSDIVRRSMGHGVAATYLQLARTAWAYIGSGALFRLMRLRKGPIAAALYPIVALLLQLALALAVAASLGIGSARGGLPDWFGALLGLGAALWVLRWFRDNDGKMLVYYLMHDYAYSARSLGANPPDLEARMTDFRRRIAGALGDDVDEVLIVGHSSGAHLAVSILADLIREGGVTGDGPALSFLSLGQVVPMVSFLPRADRLRADLHYLCGRSELTWVDVTAPGDGCAFALCDPVAVTGVAPAAGKLWPLVLSAAFSQTLSPARRRALRWQFFRLHFQYMCAFDRPGAYDYFRVTAGPLTLGARLAARQPSKGRIETAVSGYKSMAA